MPAILDRLVSQLKAQGKSESAAFAIATSQLQKRGELKPGTQEATSKGVARGMMTPGQRAIDRAVKYNGGKPSDYRYVNKTNRAVKKAHSRMK